MSLTQRLNQFASKAITAGLALGRSLPLVARVVARFDAAYTDWGMRRWLNSSYQDARFEVDYSASMELARKQIYFVENCPVIKRIENLKIQFAVGVDGLMVVPNAHDDTMDKAAIEAYNEAKAQRWAEFAHCPDLGSTLDFGQLTIQWERCLFRTGNIIVIKAYDEQGNPKIQTVDRLRLMTPPQLMGEEGKTVCQGIRLKKITMPVITIDGQGKRVKVMKEIITGQPELYYIRDEFELDKFAEVPAENVIHKFVAQQPGQMVGVPEGTAAINLIHDFTDLHILEMQASKIAGQIAVVETNPTGELSTRNHRQVGMKINSTTPNGTSVTKNSQVDYEVTVGAQKIALKNGSKIEDFMIQRPTVAQQDYWDFLLSQICIAYNVPKLLVLPYSLQGTVTRADLAVARDAFRTDFELVASVAREIYVWWSERDLKRNPANYGKKIPCCPNLCEIAPPDSPDVDIGYTANALAIEMELGVTSIIDVCTRRKVDWRTHLRNIAKAEAYIDTLATEYDVAPERIAYKMFKSGKMVDPNEDPTAPAGSSAKTDLDTNQLAAQTA
jgi:hypothetical protein